MVILFSLITFVSGVPLFKREKVSWYMHIHDSKKLNHSVKSGVESKLNNVLLSTCSFMLGIMLYLYYLCVSNVITLHT